MFTVWHNKLIVQQVCDKRSYNVSAHWRFSLRKCSWSPTKVSAFFDESLERREALKATPDGIIDRVKRKRPFLIDAIYHLTREERRMQHAEFVDDENSERNYKLYIVASYRQRHGLQGATAGCQ